MAKRKYTGRRKDGTPASELAPDLVAAIAEQNGEEVPSDVIAEACETPSDVAVEEEIVDRLEAVEGDVVPAATVLGDEIQPEMGVSVAQDFDALMAGFTDEQVTAMTLATAAAIDERADFEKVKDPENSKIQKTLDGVRKRLITKPAARVMLATAIDPAVFNRTLHEGARYNVYAMGKLADVIGGIANHEDGVKGAITNAINLACMRSLFQFRAAGMQFTGELAKACASDKIRIERAVSDHLKRHTVSASTAPTQASSTMQALETLGMVKRSGSTKNPNFDLTANPIVDKAKAVLAA